MSKNFREVIIVGAGPSGLSAAINLVELGASDVLVIEKALFPRYKCCAGYITNKTRAAYENLGLDFESCNYSLIKDFHIYSDLNKKLTIDNKFLYTNRRIDRVELDHRFFLLAKSKGIEIKENCRIALHDAEKNAITLDDGTELLYKYLIFADGTTGFGSRYQKAEKRNIAMQITFESNIPESIDIHFGITKRGYGWVSSYNGVTNIGLTDVYGKDKINYRTVFKDFTDRLGLEVDLKNLKASFTPIGVRKPVIYGNVFFVGDAVGACDPLTLSGLRYGLKSGEICAKAIKRGNAKIYKRYARNLKVKFGFMKIMLKIFYLKPVRFLVFNVFCKCFGGMVSRIFNNFFVNKK